MTSQVTALDNVALIETMTSGELVTRPSAAAYSYFAAKRDALFGNPTQNSSFFINAWLPWAEEFNATRKWDGYADKLAVRRRKPYANSILVDAHGVPGSIQNNPNDPQNELRLKRFRPLYEQATLFQNRDEFTPITVDTNQIARILQDAAPTGTEASKFISNQITQAENRDLAAEFNTLMTAISLKAGQPGIYNLNLPNLRAEGATEAQALAWAAQVRATVESLQDFVPWFSPAKNIQTVPADQVRMVIRISVMQALGTLAYGSAFNPEFVFALPKDQILSLPDHYFDRNPGLADQDMLLLDHGSDENMGSISLTDTFFDWGVDVFQMKSSENRAIHHSSILDVNPFGTFITGGQGVGTEIVSLQIVPDTITADLYGPDGTIADDGNLVRGQRYSTIASVLDADGFAAGGWKVTLSDTDSATGRTIADQYGNVQIAMDDTASSIEVTWTSIINPDVSVTQTFDLTGPAANYDGSGVIVLTTPTFDFAAGTGAGGTLTYSGVPTGTSLVGSLTGEEGPYTALGASPVDVAHDATLYVQNIASSGYVFENGTQTVQYGPYTAA